MGIRVRRFPEYGVAVHIYSGVITADDVLRHIDELEAADVVRWINYVDVSMDSRLDVTQLPELKRAAAARLNALQGGEPSASAWVSGLGLHSAVMSFWPNYLAGDEAYPVKPVAFASLEEACAWLGLPDGAWKTLAAAVTPFGTP